MNMLIYSVYTNILSLYYISVYNWLFSFDYLNQVPNHIVSSVYTTRNAAVTKDPLCPLAATCFLMLVGFILTSEENTSMPKNKCNFQLNQRYNYKIPIQRQRLECRLWGRCLFVGCVFETFLNMQIRNPDKKAIN